MTYQSGLELALGRKVKPVGRRKKGVQKHVQVGFTLPPSTLAAFNSALGLLDKTQVLTALVNLYIQNPAIIGPVTP